MQAKPGFESLLRRGLGYFVFCHSSIYKNPYEFAYCFVFPAERAGICSTLFSF